MVHMLNDLATSDFWAPRRCLLAPIPEIFEAALLLKDAVSAHNNGDKALAADLIGKADIPALALWADTLWGSVKPDVHRWRRVDNLSPKSTLVGSRMPTVDLKRKLIQRDYFRCRYCGIPVVRQEVRARIREAYPDAVRWGRRNCEQHAAFQCMWLTYDHVVPFERGGDNSLQNVVVSCWPCNGGKAQYALEELGLLDPRQSPAVKSDWSGLEEFKPQ